MKIKHINIFFILCNIVLRPPYPTLNNFVFFIVYINALFQNLQVKIRKYIIDKISSLFNFYVTYFFFLFYKFYSCYKKKNKHFVNIK